MTEQTTTRNGSAEPYILFELADCTYGVTSRELQHLEMVGSITPVPNAAPFVAGVTFSRGRVIPVIDLRRRFGLPAATATTKSRLLVVSAAGRSVGLMVDRATRFEPIAQERIQPPPAASSEAGGAFVKGIATIGERLVLLIDVEKIIAPAAARSDGPPVPHGPSLGRKGQPHDHAE